MVVCLCRTTCMCWGECCSRTVDERGGEAVDAAVCERAGNVDRPHAAGRVALNGDRASGDTATQGGVRQQHVPSRTHAQGMPRWKRRYFKLKGRRLYYAKDTKSALYDDIDLSNLSVAECSTKNINHSFQVITPSRNLVLCADTRRDMEEWISALKMAANKEYYEQGQTSHSEMMSGQHNWYACSHARPTYCNVCRDALSGVTSHGLSCEVCKFKAHKRCAVRAPTNCKWTALASIGKDIIEDEDGISMPHQWMEGNLPVSAKCVVCDKTCGSVLRLQDYRCLWCRALIHTGCRDQYPRKCPLGQCRLSILPPTAISSIDSDGYWEGMRPPGTSPLLVYVNTKSGDNQGVKFLRRFKQLMNPAQVFDLMNGGPYPGLKLFQRFDSFRILICGGDGSIGWVLTEIDKLDLHRQCQVGVLPFGTGNDLARVLGWGAAFDDDTQLPAVLEKLEHAQIKMLDRWSIWTYEGNMPPPRKLSQQMDPISQYEDSVADHLSKILHCEDHQVIISSAKVLCETVKTFVEKVAKAHENDPEKESKNIAEKCAVLNQKLESLLKTLNEESQASAQTEELVEAETAAEDAQPLVDQDVVPGVLAVPAKPKQKAHLLNSSSMPCHTQVFKARESLMSRANSLKKAVRQIIEHTEKAVDEQNAQTLELEMMRDNRHIEGSSLREASRSAPSFAALAVESEVQPEKPVPLLQPPGSRSPVGPGSRRISSMSTFNRSASVDSKLHAKAVDSITAATSPIPKIKLPFADSPVLPGISSSIAKTLAGGSFISKVLLANADALCAAASPLLEQDIPLELYQEKCVMNNYFGIGLDAKVTLEFQNKREEHPEKCRSRTKNLMWYGVLGGKEMINQTFKNLDQRVLLECDGQRIPLPSLRGIVILNIPSYGGGANFWGGSKQDENFVPPSFDDRILEVVAVFGGMQIAVSRLIDLQHHRIAQCRQVKITILGDESVPVQVDGEAWMQPPGYIRIMHKNRAQMLARDRTFENVLKSWSEKQKLERSVSPQPSALSEDEAHVVLNFVETAAMLIRCVKVASKNNTTVEQELAPLAQRASECLDRLYPSGRLSELDSSDSDTYQPTLRNQVTDLVHSMRLLHQHAGAFLSEKASLLHLWPDLEEKLTTALASLEPELRKAADIAGLPCIPLSLEESHISELQKQSKPAGRSKPGITRLKGKAFEIRSWTVEEVGAWLESLSLGEYRNNFISHEIRGAELMNLERRDLKDLGVTKVGHLKRIQQAIKELHLREAAYDRPST
ncbi:diacylglycerol kinase delta-like isoform X4 [Pomacea canaliculata]|uniref:diacylglycerol kinase delta-like isoform X4 n=1 Tax=Pomacea canaliculata TaxID=400727 RepID=UPI000D739D22|nr:diacylglycerol kinase delta-like isoform X4 [Pomacea canaliculata]